MQIEQKNTLTYSRRRVLRQPELKWSGTLIILISNLFLNLVEEIEGRGVTPLDGEDESKRHKGLLSSWQLLHVPSRFRVTGECNWGGKSCGGFQLLPNRLGVEVAGQQKFPLTCQHQLLEDHGKVPVELAVGVQDLLSLLVVQHR